MQKDGPNHPLSKFSVCLYISPTDKCLITAYKQDLKVRNNSISMVTPLYRQK